MQQQFYTQRVKGMTIMKHTQTHTCETVRIKSTNKSMGVTKSVNIVLRIINGSDFMMCTGYGK